MPDTCVLGQGFGGNANPTYKVGGLKGHPGVDEKCGYGTPVHALYDGLAYKVLTPEKPSNDGTGFTGVFQIVDNGLECFEFLTGHLTPAVVEGQAVHKGDVIGTEANHGQVFSGNIEITLAMQKAGNREGSHRHDQMRPLMPVTKTSGKFEYLIGSIQSPYRDQGGFYYQIFDFWNGYNGCVNPLLPTFNRYLTYGMSGYDVFVLQRILARKGFLAAEPTGSFYMQTWLALMKYQSANGIANTGTVGPITRAFLQKQLLPPPALSLQ